MGTFFLGWRRKMGLVVLLLACAFLAASLQGLLFFNPIIIASAKVSNSLFQDILEGSKVGFHWEHYEFPYSSGDFGQGCKSMYDIRFYRNVCENTKYDWRWR
jgi:hypothetical protein